MAYVTPTTRADGYVVDASEWNKNTVDNPIAVRTGGIAIASQAANDLIYASSATQLARLGAGTAGQFLQTNGSGSAPSFESVLAEQTTTSTGAQNDFDLTKRRSILRCTGAAPSFSGFTVAGGAPVAGDLVIIQCLGTTAKITNQDTNSTEANRIICDSTQGQIVGVNGAILLVYDGTTSRWRAVLLEAGAPVAYTPTWTAASVNPAIGNGTLTGKYVQRGKMCWFNLRMVPGGTTTFGTGVYSWSLPLTAADADAIRAQGEIVDTGTAFWSTWARQSGPGSTTTSIVLGSSGSTTSNVQPASPMTWVSTDQLVLAGEYEVA